MIRVLITDKLAQEGIDLLNSTDGVEAVVKTGVSEDELAGMIESPRKSGQAQRDCPRRRRSR